MMVLVAAVATVDGCMSQATAVHMVAADIWVAVSEVEAVEVHHLEAFMDGK